MQRNQHFVSLEDTGRCPESNILLENVINVTAYLSKEGP